MRGTPEGRYFAGMAALYYAGRERENAAKQASQQKGLAATETWFKGYAFDEIAKQLSNLNSVLKQETYYGRHGSQGAGLDNLRDAISLYNRGDALPQYSDQLAIGNSQLYVALQVTEAYVVGRVATSEEIDALRRDIRVATKQDDPKYKFDPTLLRRGIVLLREKVESRLTPHERELAERALE
jgi:hypothetical protein